MKKLQYLIIVGLIWTLGATGAWADYNEEITFTNFTDEDIDVELAVLDHSGWAYYDLTVLEFNTSIANFWTDAVFASYSACAYGIFSGDFYGCVEGELGQGPLHINYDFTLVPYLSGPPNEANADLFVFDHPNTTTGVVVVEGESHGHHGGGCFIGSRW